MGNYISRRTSDVAAGKVVLSDGTVHEFDHPVAVAELMLEHPQHFVIEFGSLMKGNRPVPLPADLTLDTDKVYLMLPMKRGKLPALSADVARRILARARPVSRSGPLSSATGVLPIFAGVCTANVVKGHELVLSRKESLIEISEKDDMPEFTPEIVGERPEFLSRQISGKGWKPTLDTIKERVVEKKVPHWLF